MTRLALLPLALLLVGANCWAQSSATPTKTTVAPAGPTKRALIVAIGEYAPGTGWSSISSLNDVAVVKAALLRQHFAEANIRVVTDAAATKAGIVAELQGLAARVQPTDVVVFHYSGHGQQIADDNHDEADGFDEALVPYDAATRYIPGQYEGQNHLRDEELGGLLGVIRRKAGPRGEVLAVLDACHSGTGTRGLARYRGTQSALAPPGFQVPAVVTYAYTQGNSFGASEGGVAGAQAPLVCYFGAGPGQLNFETTDAQGNGVGSLSLAFANALSSAATVPTYESLFDRIKGEMAGTAPTQTPQAEGNTSGRVFQGRTVLLPTHYKPTAWTNDRELTVNGGSLQGLSVNTTVALYPPDTEMGQGAQPLAIGRIVRSQLSSATVVLTQPLKGAARQTWVLVTARHYADLSVNLRVAVADAALKTRLLDSLSRRPFIKLTDAGPVDLLVEQEPGQAPRLITSHDQALAIAGASAPDPGTTVQALLDAAAAMAQTKYIRCLNTHAEGLEMVLQLLPVTVKQVGSEVQVDQQLPAASKNTDTGGVVYRVGDCLQLKVSNEGRKRAYFTILDIQPDNQMAVLVPSAVRLADLAADYVLEPGKSIVLPAILRITPPMGPEMFKIIVTEEPMDLRPLMSSRGQSQDRSLDSANPFATLLRNSNKPSGTRSGSSVGLPPEAVTITDQVFQIVKP